MIFFMPTNLPPEYFEAEKDYKQASSTQEKIAALEALISTVPKHKGTDRLRADLRKRLSKLRVEGAKKKKSGKGDLYSVEKQGAAQIALVGFANSGKSSIMAGVTHAHPMIADYPMTTVMPLSGMMPYEDIQFQLVDLPPIGNESTDGWVSGILRIADILMFVIDLSEDPSIQTDLLFEQLSEWRIPIVKKDEPAHQKGIIKPKPLIIAANKADLSGAGQRLVELRDRYGSDFPIAGIANAAIQGSDELRALVFENSRIIRVYSKEPGKAPKMDTPFTLYAGATVLELAEHIHKDFIMNLKYACIWGSGKFDGQRVQRDYALHDRDVVELHVK
jgi:ribosome-interacting GTPase 1